jgi:hypothetical protein
LDAPLYCKLHQQLLYLVAGQSWEGLLVQVSVIYRPKFNKVTSVEIIRFLARPKNHYKSTIAMNFLVFKFLFSLFSILVNGVNILEGATAIIERNWTATGPAISLMDNNIFKVNNYTLQKRTIPIPIIGGSVSYTISAYSSQIISIPAVTSGVKFGLSSPKQLTYYFFKTAMLLHIFQPARAFKLLRALSIVKV